jgi:hypothetical protein
MADATVYAIVETLSTNKSGEVYSSRLHVFCKRDICEFPYLSGSDIHLLEYRLPVANLVTTVTLQVTYIYLYLFKYSDYQKLIKLKMQVKIVCVCVCVCITGFHVIFCGVDPCE